MIRLDYDINQIAFAASRIKGITIGLQSNDMSAARIASNLEDIKAITAELAKATEDGLKTIYEAAVVDPDVEPTIPADHVVASLRDLYEQVLGPIHSVSFGVFQ